MTLTTTAGEDTDAPSFEELLLEAAITAREQAAVRALVEEGRILALDAVRRDLVHETDAGLEFTWQHLVCHLYGLGLDESGLAFLDLVLSIAWPHQTSLTRVMDLDERHLAIVLRAMVRLSGNETLAVSTRL